MAKSDQAKKKHPAIEDVRGRDWQEETDRRWAKELKENPERPRIETPPLPAFAELRSPAVEREVFGAFVVDRDADVVHSIETAKKACKVDGIANATFFHFGHEVPADVDRCPECLG